MLNPRILVVALLVASAQAFADDYRDEVELLAHKIVQTHPRGHQIQGDPDFIAARDALLEMAVNADLPHYAMATGRMFHAANDGHTALIPIYSEQPEFTWRFPLRLRRFEDGLYVIAAKGDAKELLGSRLTRIANQAIEAILRDFVAAQASGNRAWPANWTALGMSVPGFLVGLDVAPNAMTAAVRFEGMLADGTVTVADIKAAADGHQDLEELERSPGPLDELGGGTQNFFAELDSALILVIGAMEDEELQSFEAFTRGAVEALQATEAKRVIIDLRDNGGGNNMLAEPLRREIIKSRFNRPGGIYVLTSPQTFSAAMNFATRLERETDALFAGEPTGGSPNHFGDPEFATTEQSGLVYIVSTLRWQDMPPFDERPWILPDLPAPPRFEDFTAGRDLALERALEHQPEGGPEWELRRAQPWARQSQQAGWRFFYEIDN